MAIDESELAQPLQLANRELPDSDGDGQLPVPLHVADKTGKVEVQLLLRDASEAVMEQPGKLGFEVLKPAGRDLQVAGRIAIEKLAALTHIEAVRYVVRRKGD